MISALKELVHLFFALDHHNYAKWIPIFIQDLENLPETTNEEFRRGHFAVNRSNRRFSSIPIDHAHEQVNKKIKGVGGAIGLTENPQMLERWMVAGPELSRVLEEFEGVQHDLEELPHHEEGAASQRRFLCHVRDLIDVVLMSVNPFEEQLKGLVSLDNKVCEAPESADSVYLIEPQGKEQFIKYQKCVLESRETALTAPIKKNKLRLYKETKVKKRPT